LKEDNQQLREENGKWKTIASKLSRQNTRLDSELSLANEQTKQLGVANKCLDEANKALTEQNTRLEDYMKRQEESLNSIIGK
jgi:predicted nuclease with TOPRIM domain